MATRPPPKTPRTTTMVIPVMKVIKEVDPDFERARKSEIEYDFGPKGRVFVANPVKRGAYAPPEE